MSESKAVAACTLLSCPEYLSVCCGASSTTSGIDDETGNYISACSACGEKFQGGECNAADDLPKGGGKMPPPSHLPTCSHPDDHISCAEWIAYTAKPNFWIKHPFFTPIMRGFLLGVVTLALIEWLLIPRMAAVCFQSIVGSYEESN